MDTSYQKNKELDEFALGETKEINEHNKLHDKINDEVSAKVNAETPIIENLGLNQVRDGASSVQSQEIVGNIKNSLENEAHDRKLKSVTPHSGPAHNN